MTKNRRTQILKFLTAADAPMSASALAKKCHVSRQIIVGDIALLRAEGNLIDATPRGYVFAQYDAGIRRTIACVHDSSMMKEELYAIVDEGASVLDVIVEHPVYGQLTGNLHLCSRYDVDQFIRNSEAAEALPLSVLTEGIHLHTILCRDEDTYQRVVARLRSLSILL